MGTCITGAAVKGMVFYQFIGTRYRNKRVLVKRRESFTRKLRMCGPHIMPSNPPICSLALIHVALITFNQNRMRKTRQARQDGGRGGIQEQKEQEA